MPSYFKPGKIVFFFLINSREVELDIIDYELRAQNIKIEVTFKTNSRLSLSVCESALLPFFSAACLDGVFTTYKAAHCTVEQQPIVCFS